MSKNLQRRVARLAFVQHLYGLVCQENYDTMSLDNIIQTHTIVDIDDDNFHTTDKKMDKELYITLRKSYHEHCIKLHDDIKHHLLQHNKFDENAIVQDMLLYVILVAGCLEIAYHHNINQQIIINDYIEICKSFFAQKQPSLVNAFLDEWGKIF